MYWKQSDRHIWRSPCNSVEARKSVDFITSVEQFRKKLIKILKIRKKFAFIQQEQGVTTKFDYRQNTEYFTHTLYFVITLSCLIKKIFFTIYKNLGKKSTKS